MNTSTELALKIESAALNNGFTSCGIIPIEDMAGYTDKFMERLNNVPESKPFYEHIAILTQIKERFPWAKSLVICTTGYRHYRYPQSLRHKYAKSFLLSRDSVPVTNLHKQKKRFTDTLTSYGLRWFGGGDASHLQVGGLRYAAYKAGLGIIRKNNFFYDENGSYTELDGYVIDAECTLYHQKNFRPCSSACTLCQQACPAQALQGPYCVNPLRCLSYCNTFGQGVYPPDLSDKQLGHWIIGCDTCQDVCPYNRGKNWDEGDAFPGLADLEPYFDPHYLAEASDKEIIDYIIPKTVMHITPEQTEVVRRNALRVLSMMSATDNSSSHTTHRP